MGLCLCVTCDLAPFVGRLSLPSLGMCASLSRIGQAYLCGSVSGPCTVCLAGLVTMLCGEPVLGGVVQHFSFHLVFSCIFLYN